MRDTPMRLPSRTQRREPFKMPYDFSDAMDRAKAPQAVLDLYPQFGLVVTEDPAGKVSEIPDEDLEHLAHNTGEF